MGKWKPPKFVKDVVKTATNVVKNTTPIGVAAGLTTGAGLVKENPLDSVSRSIQEGDVVKTGTNLIKNFTPTGQLAGALQATGITKKNLIDQAVGLFTGKKGGGGGGGGGPGAPGPEDIGSISKRYEQALEQQRLKNVQVGGELTESLRKQAMGEAPSLAEAQLKSAQSRNLAQTLAAAQSAGASPLATRQMLQMRGQQGRELAETGSQMALQERQAAQAALGGQLASQAGIVRSDVESGFGIAKTPAQMAQEKQLAQMQYEAQKDVAKQQRIAQERAAIWETGGNILSSFLPGGGSKTSDVNQKKNIKPAKKQVQSFLDALEAREYEYKDASLPGTTEGRELGVMAQDMEKSSLGKKLIEEAPHGKMVNMQKGFGAVLAAQAELNRRLKKLEKKGK